MNVLSISVCSSMLFLSVMFHLRLENFLVENNLHLECGYYLLLQLVATQSCQMLGWQIHMRTTLVATVCKFSIYTLHTYFVPILHLFNIKMQLTLPTRLTTTTPSSLSHPPLQVCLRNARLLA